VIQQWQGYQFARTAGLPKEQAILASAVMMAESGGDERQITDDADDLSYGLWQINMKGTMGPTRRALYGLSKNEDLLDPATNARVMSAISHQGTNWQPWGAYTNGSYKKFMPPNVADPSIARYTQKPVEKGWADSVAAAGDALQKTASWVSNQKNWVRVAYVLGGGILVVVALQAIIMPYASQGAGTAAKFVAPYAKVASKVKGKVKS
jgi:hypothetical protein